MTDAERDAILGRLRKFAAQEHEAEELADQGSLDRGAEIMALYEDRGWVKELPPPKVRRSRGRPVDPESFSRFSKWLADQTRLSGRHAYRLRDGHELAANYLTGGQIKPSGEWEVRPLKWLRRHGYDDRIPEVWSLACELAGGHPDNPTVRKALSQWKHDNLPKVERKPTERGARAKVNQWIREAERLMQDYPEFFVDAINKVEEKAEEHFSRKAA